MTAEGLAATKVALLSAVDTLSLDDGGAFLGEQTLTERSG